MFDLFLELRLSDSEFRPSKWSFAEGACSLATRGMFRAMHMKT